MSHADKKKSGGREPTSLQALGEFPGETLGPQRPRYPTTAHDFKKTSTQR